MRFVRSLEAMPGVYQLRSVGAWVTAISTGDGVVLVDAGARGATPLLSRRLKRLGVAPDHVRLIVVTHHHPDHAGGVSELARTTGAKVAAHRLEAGVLMGKEPPPNPYRSPVRAGIVRLVLPFLYDNSIRVDYLLEDGDRLPIAEDISVVHTPGHTPGSICLYVVAKRLLIVGDMLQYRSGRLLPAAPGVSHDPRQAVDSLRQLLPLDFDAICFSHYRPLRHDAHSALEQLVEQTGR